MITSDKEIKNIIFDFGGVILDIDIDRTVNAFEKLGITGFSANEIHPNTQSVFEDLEKGIISTRQFFDIILEKYPTNKNVSQKELFEAWAALLLPFRQERIDIIKKLNAEGYNTYILSNTNYPHRVRFLNSFSRQFGYDMETLFEQCYYSDELGIRKPDINIYKHILKDSQLNPRETVFIDDNMDNLVMAEQCGLKTYLLKASQGETIVDIF